MGGSAQFVAAGAGNIPGSAQFVAEGAGSIPGSAQFTAAGAGQIPGSAQFVGGPVNVGRFTSQIPSTGFEGRNFGFQNVSGGFRNGLRGTLQGNFGLASRRGLNDQLGALRRVSRGPQQSIFASNQIGFQQGGLQGSLDSSFKGLQRHTGGFQPGYGRRGGYGGQGFSFGFGSGSGYGRSGRRHRGHGKGHKKKGADLFVSQFKKDHKGLKHHRPHSVHHGSQKKGADVFVNDFKKSHKGLKHHRPPSVHPGSQKKGADVFVKQFDKEHKSSKKDDHFFGGHGSGFGGYSGASSYENQG